VNNRNCCSSSASPRQRDNYFTWIAYGTRHGLESYRTLESRYEETIDMVHLHIYLQYAWSFADYLSSILSEKRGEIM